MAMADRHVGLVAGADIESMLDLANVLHEAGTAVTLYLSFARAARLAGLPAMAADEDVAAQFYERELVPPDCPMRLVHYPRLRDPRSLGVVRRAIGTMRADGVELVHISIGPTELWLAVMANLIRDLPVVTTYAQPKPNVGENRPPWLDLAINRLVARGSDVLAVTLESMVPYIQETYSIPAERTAYVPLCPRVTALRWAAEPVPEEPGTVLFFGGARRHKGLEYLVRAQPMVNREVPDARFLIAAHGNDLDRCLALIQEPERFEVHRGFVPGDEMPTFYQRASLVALPYISAGPSGVLLDAYGFGKPVVASEVGGLPEYVQDGTTGILVPPADERELAAGIIHLLSDDKLRYRMGDNARRWIEDLKQSIAARWSEVYEQAMSFRRAKARGVQPTAAEESQP
jgi:alpha-maltose-1-phosphate synthase